MFIILIRFGLAWIRNIIITRGSAIIGQEISEESQCVLCYCPFSFSQEKKGER